MFAIPRVSRRHASRAALLLALVLLAGAGRAAEPADPTAALDPALRDLDAGSRTGVIYDRVLPLAHLERLDGGDMAPATDLATWRQGYDELRRASRGPAAPDLGALDAGATGALRAGVIPLAVLDRAVERIRPGALEDGSLRLEQGRLVPTGAAPLVEWRVFAAAALAPRTYRGADVTFALDPERWFSDAPVPPRSLEIDLDDGTGLRRVALGERVHAHYAATGRRTLRFRLTRADGTTAEARTRFDVAALATPMPDDTLHITATIPYQGEFGTGDAYVYRAPGHATLENPAVVIEGFDLDNSMNWDELYALLDQENLIETLRADGFDIVVLNFADATVAIQQNAFVVAELIQQVQAAIPPQATLALVGASMGGLCSRYALGYLESHAVPHRVRTWISFDAPQAGADIPLGLQYWIRFFSGQSADAAAFLATLDRPAARQMLIYHYVDPASPMASPDPLRAGLLADLDAAGGFPALTRRVAIANGSGDRQTQGFLPGDQLIRWEYNSAFVAITGDVWAVPDGVATQIFKGSIRILFSTSSQNVSVSATQPWDGAPGGLRASLAQVDSSEAPYGDIVALHPAHCFIPTISALALPTGDPFYDIAGDPDLVAHTPFDAVYVPAANQEHVLITPENAAWVRSEIESQVTAVGPAPAGPGTALTLATAPNPFRHSTRIAFSLPAPGPVDLRVFGVDGREVRRLLREDVPAGPRTVGWDGRDARGASAPAGLYFVRLVAARSARTRTLAKLE